MGQKEKLEYVLRWLLNDVHLKILFDIAFFLSQDLFKVVDTCD